jgi:aryl-alcohol dehydrogenase
VRVLPSRRDTVLHPHGSGERLESPARRHADEFVLLGLGMTGLTVNANDLLFKGQTLRGCLAGDAAAHDFIPRLVELHTTGRFPIDRLVSRYPAREINRAIADHESGEIVKPVLMW